MLFDVFFFFGNAADRIKIKKIIIYLFFLFYPFLISPNRRLYNICLILSITKYYTISFIVLFDFNNRGRKYREINFILSKKIINVHYNNTGPYE